MPGGQGSPQAGSGAAGQPTDALSLVPVADEQVGTFTEDDLTALLANSNLKTWLNQLEFIDWNKGPWRDPRKIIAVVFAAASQADAVLIYIDPTYQLYGHNAYGRTNVAFSLLFNFFLQAYFAYPRFKAITHLDYKKIKDSCSIEFWLKELSKWVVSVLASVMYADVGSGRFNTRGHYIAFLTNFTFFNFAGVEEALEEVVYPSLEHRFVGKFILLAGADRDIRKRYVVALEQRRLKKELEVLIGSKFDYWLLNSGQPEFQALLQIIRNTADSPQIRRLKLLIAVLNSHQQRPVEKDFFRQLLELGITLVIFILIEVGFFAYFSNSLSQVKVMFGINLGIGPAVATVGANSGLGYLMSRSIAKKLVDIFFDRIIRPLALRQNWKLSLGVSAMLLGGAVFTLGTSLALNKKYYKDKLDPALFLMLNILTWIGTLIFNPWGAISLFLVIYAAYILYWPNPGRDQALVAEAFNTVKASITEMNASATLLALVFLHENEIINLLAPGLRNHLTLRNWRRGITLPQALKSLTDGTTHGVSYLLERQSEYYPRRNRLIFLNDCIMIAATIGFYYASKQLLGPADSIFKLVLYYLGGSIILRLQTLAGSLNNCCKYGCFPDVTVRARLIDTAAVSESAIVSRSSSVGGELAKTAATIGVPTMFAAGAHASINWTLRTFFFAENPMAQIGGEIAGFVVATSLGSKARKLIGSY
ncbi:MAG: hypothetical protein A3E87_04865 [Gammaproteobacteria bacterium RIFCSPHIGHO2_12_FULL_35_23]|nr:MAG: hypothetical protein A3E87_04865 [Gammaproteobacteria bacterium RIFCSPHIGHO2_12_FULL_35_23]